MEMRFNRGNAYFDTYYIYDKWCKVGIIEDHCRAVTKRYFVGWKLDDNVFGTGKTESFDTIDEAMVYSVGQVVPRV